MGEATPYARVGRWPRPGVPSVLGQRRGAASGKVFLLSSDCWPGLPTPPRGLHPAPDLL